ncbi:hypothetical protein [Bacillus sp. B15-48]|uniref:hypothetical protein n=1 Tax=Bacillus sp. B15-48 TaxID=1548601 RepID=UPI00193F76E8|nr:hypothetical protein [Bacillus sp. B15-48]MBM4762050.1 hypothetical protein [Bacillus sp. B15-48]
MFDPTAFDNIKVVVEGAIYDKDLDGDIRIVDRDDIINLAKLSRRFSLSFSLSHQKRNSVIAVLIVEAALKNLAAEILDHAETSPLAGAEITVSFLLTHEDDPILYNEIQRLLETIWGNDRTISQVASFHPVNKGTLIENKTTVHFNRLVREDHIEDLTEMVEYMVISLQELENIM